MQDEENMVEEDFDESPEEYDELSVLQQRCDILGIKYHPRAGVDKLRAKIEAHQAKNTEGLGEADIQKLQATNPKKPFLTHEEYMKETRQATKRNVNRLVRCRVSCMNPNKKEWEGEIFSVGSSRLGTFKKFVPFGHITHVPNIIYEHIKERQYTQFYNAKGPRGERIRKGRLTNEFAVETLDPLTPAELKELGQRQLMARGEEDQ